MYFDSFNTVMQALLSLCKDWLALRTPIGVIIKELFPGQRRGYEEVWPILARDTFRFWHLTGETQDTLQELVDGLPDDNVNGRPTSMTKRDSTLMALIWLRQYPTLTSLATMFGIPYTVCRRTIQKRVLQLYGLLAREVTWHVPAVWRSIAGRHPDFPSVVGLIDGTVIRINIPSGKQ
jgi:hypothetical protein